LILAGRVLANEQKVAKAGANVDDASEIRIIGDDLKYVSRGGLKLERALEHWAIDVAGKVCMDVGTSTGGFTDCILQNGAAKVIAVDTGYGQIDARLPVRFPRRLLGEDERTISCADAVSESIQFLAMDVSFISATLVLPAVVKALLRRPR